VFIKIIQLPKFRAVSFHVKESEEPEKAAWQQLKSWAVPRGMFDNPTIFQIYGRNHPTPTEQQRLRGYEFLITIPDDYQTGADVSEVIFPGGLYAVAASRGIQTMIENYEKIFDWIKKKTDFIPDYPESYDYLNAPGLELEHHINPHDDTNSDTFLIDAYIPIEKPSV